MQLCRCEVAPVQLCSAVQVLSGTGVYDGTEVHEAAAAMAGITRGGATVQCYAPDACQMHVIDHTKVRRASAPLYVYSRPDNTYQFVIFNKYGSCLQQLLFAYNVRH